MRRVLIDYHGIKQSFKTENRTSPPELIEIRLVSGPFRQLDGHWRFTALRRPRPARSSSTCTTNFPTGCLEKLVGPVFKHIANTLLDAFLRRADQLYGK